MPSVVQQNQNREAQIVEPIEIIQERKKAEARSELDTPPNSPPAYSIAQIIPKFPTSARAEFIDMQFTPEDDEEPTCAECYRYFMENQKPEVQTTPENIQKHENAASSGFNSQPTGNFPEYTNFPLVQPFQTSARAQSIGLDDYFLEE